MENKENRKEETVDQILREIRMPEETAEPAPSGGGLPETKQDAEAEKSAGKDPKKEKPKNGLLADLAALLLRLGWIAFILAILLMVVCGVTVNSGERMAPAFHDRDIVVFYRLAKDVKAGEVVVFRGQNDRVLVGRVVARGGDTVDIDENGLKINGYYQTEPYRRGDTVLFEGGAAFPVKLRAGELFILCDDRSDGSDSRTFGPVSSDRVLGRVMLSIRQRDF